MASPLSEKMVGRVPHLFVPMLSGGRKHCFMFRWRHRDHSTVVRPFCKSGKTEANPWLKCSLIHTKAYTISCTRWIRIWMDLLKP